MRKLWRDRKGMVTVMVTLLLVPSLLVSGTAVDIARIYTAKSILQDANQLAANSTLASYDALLQDLYGLYGLMQNDPALGDMVDEYIKLSIVGQKEQDRGLGTFQLFYGSEIEPGDVTPATGQNLGNTEVLRRQIEEYAKFRVPVVLVDELLDRLNAFEKAQKDADVIEQKMELDDGLEDLEQIYKRIYNNIAAVNAAQTALDDSLAALNDVIGDIRDNIVDLVNVRDQYTDYVTHLPDTAEPGEAEHWAEVIEDYETRYEALQSNIKALVRGGRVKSFWVQGKWVDQEAGIWLPGYYQDSNAVPLSLKKAFKNLDEARKNAKSALDALVLSCQAGDQKKADLKKKLEAFERTLDTPGSCSDDLRKGMTEKKPENGNKSAVDIYRDALKYDLEPMATVVRGANAPRLNEIKEWVADPKYGDIRYDGLTVSLDDLTVLSNSAGFELDLLVYNKAHASAPKQDTLKLLWEPGLSLCQYKFETAYKIFQAPDFNATKNSEFYDLLQNMFGSVAGEAKKSTAKKAATKVLGEAQKKFKQALLFEPEGAWLYSPAGGGGGSESKVFGEGNDWTKEDEGKDEAKAALKGDLVQSLGNIANKAANRILLLGYDSEMFSCYTTNKGGEAGRVSMAGIPLGIDVNYFYQSELEYLYAGQNDARANLKTVAGMIFLVRFVFNYIASFNVSEVNALVESVKGALTGIAGPFAFLIGELVRLGMALGESAVDVVRLKAGDAVELYKSDASWTFSVSGLLSTAGDGLSENVQCVEKGGNQSAVDGFTYRDYVRVFLLLKSDAELATRTKRLIELNLTNKKNGIGGKGDREQRQAAMSNAPQEDLSKAITGFSITTKAELRMIFLSMPVAQRGVDGVVPPGSIEISTTDYRGY